MKGDSRSVVAIERLIKRFGSHTVLDGVDLTVQTGEMVALLGSSGSGKSTLLRCLNLLTVPTAGRITISGGVLFKAGGDQGPVLLKGRELNRLRARIGMVFQQFNLFPHMTALGNVMEGPKTVLRLGDEKARSRAQALLAQVGLAEHAAKLPAQLSGGQQQRVSIARALAMQPELMLFDEPTSALDPELVGEVLRVMIDLARGGMTMIVVTHELGFALEVADRVLFLDGGRLVAAGPPREVLLRPEHPRLKAFVERFHETARLLKPLID